MKKMPQVQANNTQCWSSGPVCIWMLLTLTYPLPSMLLLRCPTPNTMLAERGKPIISNTILLNTRKAALLCFRSPEKIGRTSVVAPAGESVDGTTSWVRVNSPLCTDHDVQVQHHTHRNSECHLHSSDAAQWVLAFCDGRSHPNQCF